MLSPEFLNGSRVFVSDLVDLNGVITLFGRYVGQRISSGLSQDPNIRVVDRHSLDTILKEQKFQASDLVNESTAVQFGELVGADFIVAGTVSELQTQIEINVKVVNVEKGVVLFGRSYPIPKDPETAALVGTIILSEAEKQRVLEEKRRTITAEIESQKAAMLVAMNAEKEHMQQEIDAARANLYTDLKQEEAAKRAEIGKLNQEIREKSIVLVEYRKKQEELQHKKDQIAQIHWEIDQSTKAVPEKLKIGMTRGQVRSVFPGGVTCEGECCTVGQYLLLFEGEVLVRGAKIGSQGGCGTVYHCVSLMCCGYCNQIRY